jgi:hypothetical protein
MSYCRFENVFHDLEDCYEHLNDPLSESEREYRLKLLSLCQDMIREYQEDEVYKDEDEETVW